jgi:hypothetical protein
MLKISALLVATALSLSAEIQEKVIDYADGDTALEGFYAHDPAVKSTGKAVLIVHQWTGLGENEKMRARMLANLGYQAFALDIYGKGVRPVPPAAGSSTASASPPDSPNSKNSPASLRKISPPSATALAAPVSWKSPAPEPLLPASSPSTVVSVLPMAWPPKKSASKPKSSSSTGPMTHTSRLLK